MPKFNFDTTNIFMKFTFRSDSADEESVMFLYSNTDGMMHLKNVLNENPLFSNLLTPEEILIKMRDEISYLFGVNNYTGLDRTAWIEKHVVIRLDEKETYDNQFPVWKNQLEKFVGKNNLFTVEMPRTMLSEFMEKMEDPSNEELLNFIESYKLNLSLRGELTVNQVDKKKLKL